MEAELVIKAIQNARAKGKFKEGAIFHSDLGLNIHRIKLKNI